MLLVDEHRHAATEGLPHRHGLLDPEVVEHGEDVGGHLGEREPGPSRRGVRAAVTAQVDGDGTEHVAHSYR
jgi:hypothetical protein